MSKVRGWGSERSYFLAALRGECEKRGIDGGFLKDAGIQITEMNSGCICCSLVGDFGRNLHEVIGKYHPDRILIEPSGVGKLSDVMKSVIDVEKEEDVKLNGLITVVNALKASKQMKAFGEFFNNQIEYATTVVLSRSQNATPEQLELCVKQIQSINDKAAIITTRRIDSYVNHCLLWLNMLMYKAVVRSIPERYSHQGQQLYGCFSQGGNRCVRHWPVVE